MNEVATYLCVDCKTEFAPDELEGAGGEFLEALNDGTQLILCAGCA